MLHPSLSSSNRTRPFTGTMSSSPQIFYADAVLFDMDGTLTDSTLALEAAWVKFAEEIGEDPQYIIAATHGKRAADNIAHFKPHLKNKHEIDDEVTKFEETALFFADAYRLHGPGSKFRDSSSQTPIDQTPKMNGSGATTPSLTRGTSIPFSVSSCSNDSRRSLLDSGDIQLEIQYGETIQDNDFLRESDIHDVAKNKDLEEWQLEAASIDRAMHILPGVKRLIDSIPDGRYAVATSATRTFGCGCMNRVGITPPPVTITADDKRLKAGKPAPDPFLLAAKCLGYDPKKCVVFEDSPAGIRSGVASGATVIAVCTSHDRSKIENYGAHYVVENMNYVSCEVEGDRLKFSVVA